MKISNRSSVITGIVLLLTAALFSISLILQIFDFGTGSPGHDNLFFLMGTILYSVYGFSSILIPAFLLLTGLSCFATKWTAKRTLHLLTAIVPFFTAVLTENICRSILKLSDTDFVITKITITILIGIMLIVIEYLFIGVVADKVNDTFYKITKQPKPTPEQTEAFETTATNFSDIKTAGDINEQIYQEPPVQLQKEPKPSLNTADTENQNSENQNISTQDNNNADDDTPVHSASMLTQEEYAALISPDAGYDIDNGNSDTETDELEWPNLPPAPEALPPEYSEDFSEDDPSLEFPPKDETDILTETSKTDTSATNAPISETPESATSITDVPETAASNEDSVIEDDIEYDAAFSTASENSKNDEDINSLNIGFSTTETLSDEDLSELDVDFDFADTLADDFSKEPEKIQTIEKNDDKVPPYSSPKYNDNVVENYEYPHGIQLHSDDEITESKKSESASQNNEVKKAPQYPAGINLASNTEPLPQTEIYSSQDKIPAKEENAQNQADAPETSNAENQTEQKKTIDEPEGQGYSFSSHHIPPEPAVETPKKAKKPFSTAISDIFSDMKKDIHKKNLREEHPEMSDEEFEHFYEENYNQPEKTAQEQFEKTSENPVDSDITDVSYDKSQTYNPDDELQNDASDDELQTDASNINSNIDSNESYNEDKNIDLDSEIAEYDELSDSADADATNQPPQNEQEYLNSIIQYEEPPKEDASDLTADDLETFFNAQQAENIPQTNEIKGNLPTNNRATKKGPYVIPSDLLTAYKDDQYWIIDDDTKKASLMLKQTLAEFHIEAEITGIKKGPVVTMFEILPAPGVKLQRIVSLQDNIALALAAKAVRIVAPIPGKQAVGIEVPNKDRSIVGFREIIEMDLPEYNKMTVPVVLGKDILGKAQLIDLVKTPHMLIAGATGSGKSVCVNSLILSILYKRSYKDVKLILVDPKVVELKLYNNIPHLLTPVITEPKKAFQALQYCLCEMERRYALLDSVGVRDIASYNQRIKERNICTEKLPYIVVIIDEFADLMATTGRELESVVARLTAMSRAVGIHLVLATQRPSVNVITGLIKANIPSRIAFMVASRTDSNIIIDSVGAEKLLGRGDMLYASAVDPFPVRIQGTYVTDQEVENVVEYVKQFGEPDYIDDEIFIEDEDEVSENVDLFGNPVDDDPLYDQALEIVVQAGKASASYIQRRLKIGYNRAARLVEEMEERGIVGPANGSKAREIIHVP